MPPSQASPATCTPAHPALCCHMHATWSGRSVKAARHCCSEEQHCSGGSPGPARDLIRRPHTPHVQETCIHPCLDLPTPHACWKHASSCAQTSPHPTCAGKMHPPGPRHLHTPRVQETCILLCPGLPHPACADPLVQVCPRLAPSQPPPSPQCWGAAAQTPTCSSAVEAQARAWAAPAPPCPCACRWLCPSWGLWSAMQERWRCTWMCVHLCQCPWPRRQQSAGCAL